MIDTDSSTQTRISLLRGQAHCERLPQGTLIRVTSGTVSITSQVWVENTLLTVTTPVYPGGVLELSASGWHEIAARSEAELLMVLPLKGFQRAWRRINWLISQGVHL